MNANVSELLAKFAPSVMQEAQEQVDEDVAIYEEKNRQWLDQRAEEYKAGIESTKTARMFWLTLGTACVGTLSGFVFLNVFGLWQGLAMAGAVNSATFLTAKKKLMAVVFTSVSLVSVLGYFGHHKMVNSENKNIARLELNATTDEATSTESLAVAGIVLFGAFALASGMNKKSSSL